WGERVVPMSTTIAASPGGIDGHKLGRTRRMSPWRVQKTLMVFTARSGAVSGRQSGMDPGGHLRIGSPPGAPHFFLLLVVLASLLAVSLPAAPRGREGPSAAGPIVFTDRANTAGLRFETTYGG